MFKCYAKATLEFKSNVDFHPLRNYKIVSVLIKELLILVGVLKTSFIKTFAYFCMWTNGIKQHINIYSAI